MDNYKIMKIMDKYEIMDKAEIMLEPLNNSSMVIILLFLITLTLV